MTIDSAAARLEAAGVPDARFDALCIAEHVTGRSRASLLSDRSADIPLPSFEEAVARRELREPLQYILGKWEFMGIPFYTDPSCLIPRADTEILAGLIIERLPAGGSLLDMCTGGGCVAVAAAYHRPDVRAVGADVSEKAISTAVKNARLNGVEKRVSFAVHDVRTAWGRDEKFDFVAANPPYVAADEMKTLEPELRFEPEIALTDGGDGLSLIEAFLRFALPVTKKGGTVAVEHGAGQGEAVRAAFSRLGLDPATVNDLGGMPRVTCAEI